MDRKASRNRSGVTVLAREFLADIGRRGYSPRTVAIYGQALRDFGRFLKAQGILSAQEVTTANVEAYRRRLQERGFSPAGEEVYARAVKRLFDYLVERQQVFETPFAGAGPIRRERKLMPVPSEAEMQALLDAPDVATPRGLRTRAILEVAYGTGTRLEELARMKFADLDLANGTVRTMGKGSRERVVPMGASAVEWVRRYLAEARARYGMGEGTALWLKDKGKPIGPQGISRSIQECVRKAALTTPITPHAIRRACATHMLRRGASPVQLQMLLGHASLRHLSAYLRVTFHELQAMHERSRLGQ